MNLDEAYKILELSPGASLEDAKKKRRELMKKYHPDVNKEPDAEEKFKKVNEAFNIIEKPQPQHFQPSGGSGINIQDFMNRKRNKNANTPPVNLNAHISFKDSIFGCKREFTYDRQAKCDECGGQGLYNIHNGCDMCGGRGVVVRQQGQMIIQQTCTKCRGRTAVEECKTCSGTGALKATRSITVMVPGGISNGTTLRLEGMGHFVDIVNDFFGSGEMCTDAFVKVNVAPADFKYSLKNNNLHTTLDIPLIDALKGCKKTVKTLEGDKEIVIPAKTKNGEQVIIPNLGVSREGNHVVDINVDYPQDIDSLISHLSK